MCLVSTVATLAMLWLCKNFISLLELSFCLLDEKIATIEGTVGTVVPGSGR